VLMYRRRPSAALVPSRDSLPRTSWVELKLRDITPPLLQKLVLEFLKRYPSFSYDRYFFAVLVTGLLVLSCCQTVPGVQYLSYYIRSNILSYVAVQVCLGIYRRISLVLSGNI
jgi:hypothetical protein